MERGLGRQRQLMPSVVIQWRTHQNSKSGSFQCGAHIGFTLS